MIPIFSTLILTLIGGVTETPSDLQPRPLSISGPRVAKLDWNTRSVIAADINGDTLTDLAVINNDRAKIELLIQVPTDQRGTKAKHKSTRKWQPEFSDVPFDKTSVVISVAGFALAAGDLNGDGHTDLAYTGRPNGLTVRYQDGKGWERKRTFNLEKPSTWLETLLIVDINRDDLDELVVLTQTSLLLFDQIEDGELGGPKIYPLSDPSLGLCTLDANTDGLPDLLYQAPGKKKSLRLRMNQGDAGFGPELLFELPAPATFFRPVTRPNDATDGFVYIQSESNLLCHMGFDTTPDSISFQDVCPRVFGTPNANGNSSYAFGDFNGDGRLDLAWASSSGAQVSVFFQNELGSLTQPMMFPCFADPKSLSAGDIDGDGTDDLIVASSKEKTLGVSSLKDQTRMSYPTPLPGTGQPLAVANADLDGDGIDEIVSLHAQDGTRSVTVLRRTSGEDDWDTTTQILEDLKTDPRAIRIVDANQDGKLDLLIFTVQEPLRFLMGSENGEFTPLDHLGDYQQGLLHNLKPSALTLGDINDDGKPEMLVAGKGYGRALKVHKKGKLKVIDQFNARTSEDRISAVFAVDITGDGQNEILLAHPSDNELQVLKRRFSGVFRYSSSLSIGELELVSSAVVDLQGNGAADLFLLGQDRFMWIPVLSQDIALTRIDTFETGLEDVWFDDLSVGDLNGDGRPDIIAVDSESTQIMELWQGQADGTWSPHLHFTVFEKDPHYRGRQGADFEPREIIAADVTGDQKQDLVLLVHDRILVYPQF